MAYLIREAILNDSEIPSTVACTTKITASSIRLDWDERYKTEYINYDVKYRVDGTMDFERLETKQKFIEINELKSDTLYNVCIFGVNFEGDSSPIVRGNLKTDKSNFSYLKGNSKLIEYGKIGLYQLEPAHVDSDEEGCLRTCYMSKYISNILKGYYIECDTQTDRNKYELISN